MDGPKLCIMFRSVWMVLNSLYPRKLWLLTVNNLSPKVSINIYLYILGICQVKFDLSSRKQEYTTYKFELFLFYLCISVL